MREPIKIKSGSIKRIDYEYERCGTCNIIIASEPLPDKLYVKIKEKKNWAIFSRQISDE